MSLFDLLYLLLLALLSPIIVAKSLINPEIRRLFLAHLFIDYRATDKLPPVKRRRIWIHGASVGETNLAIKLVKQWEKSHPDLDFILTTNTITAFSNIQARTRYPLFYCPFDLSVLIRRFIGATNVTDLLLIETEIWPNMIRIMEKRGKIIILNGRLSDRYFSRYLKWRPLLKSTFSKIDLVLAREKRSADRFHKLQVDLSKIQVAGNLKCELTPAPPGSLLNELRDRYNLSENQHLFLAASIQPEETTPVVNSWKSAKREIPHLILVIVPRHPEKRDEFARILDGYPFPVHFTSQPTQTDTVDIEENVLVVDEVGVLRCWYALANSVFVGGSLCQRGGQNMLEAVSLLKPVCVGPHTLNFSQEVKMLTEVDGLTIVHNESDLTEFLLTCHNSPMKAGEMAHRGQQIIVKHSVALERSVRLLNNEFFGENG